VRRVISTRLPWKPTFLCPQPQPTTSNCHFFVKFYKPIASLDGGRQFVVEFAQQSHHSFQLGGTVILSSYFVPMSVVHDLATDLGLRVGDDSIISNAHLQSVYNGWLAKNLWGVGHCFAQQDTCPSSCHPL
jgi:hypothetical protein